MKEAKSQARKLEAILEEFYCLKAKGRQRIAIQRVHRHPAPTRVGQPKIFASGNDKERRPDSVMSDAVADLSDLGHRVVRPVDGNQVPGQSCLRLFASHFRPTRDFPKPCKQSSLLPSVEKDSAVHFDDGQRPLHVFWLLVFGSTQGKKGA